MVRRAASLAVLALFIVIVATLLVNGCGGGGYNPVGGSPPPAPTPAPIPTPNPTPTPTPNPTPTPSSVTIEIVGESGGMSFSPNPRSVTVGSQVRWHNGDVIAHSATQNGGAFDTGLIPPGGTSAPITMGTTGSFAYHCSVHPTMVGTLNVTN